MSSVRLKGPAITHHQSHHPAFANTQIDDRHKMRLQHRCGRVQLSKENPRRGMPTHGSHFDLLVVLIGCDEGCFPSISDLNWLLEKSLRGVSIEDKMTATLSSVNIPRSTHQLPLNIQAKAKHTTCKEKERLILIISVNGCC